MNITEQIRTSHRLGAILAIVPTPGMSYVTQQIPGVDWSTRIISGEPVNFESPNYEIGRRR